MLNKEWDGNWSRSEPQEAVSLEIKKPGFITIKPPQFYLGRTQELSRKTENIKGGMALHASVCFHLIPFWVATKSLRPLSGLANSKGSQEFYLLASFSDWVVSFLLWLSCMRYLQFLIFLPAKSRASQRRISCFSWEGGGNHIAL